MLYTFTACVVNASNCIQIDSNRELFCTPYNLYANSVHENGMKTVKLTALKGSISFETHNLMTRLLKHNKMSIYKTEKKTRV